jgi:signal transduction histidine kinase
MVAPAALTRAVLLGRAAATLTAAGAGLRLVGDPQRLIIVLVIVVVTTVIGLAVISRTPGVVRYPLSVLAVDTLIVLAVLVISRGGVAYFCCAVGTCALAGVLLGMRALVLCALHTALGYVIAAVVLTQAAASPEASVFVLAFPMADVLAGIGAAVATTALTRFVNLSVEAVASAQRSAAASERTRLARELHDSVTKTLRGVSFAALALPSSLRRHPDLAEQLANTVSEGANAAALQARELLAGLRLDDPDQDFAATLRGICRRWEETTAMPIQVDVAPINPPVEVRYELSRILQEALRNIAQHAEATRVWVSLAQSAQGLRLRIDDDGRGFHVQDDLSLLQATGHFGIVGMHERMSTIEGSLHITSRPGVGTSIEASVPPSAARLEH